MIKYFIFTQANVIIWVTWSFAVSFAIFPLVGWNRYVAEVGTNNATLNIRYLWSKMYLLRVK